MGDTTIILNHDSSFESQLHSLPQDIRDTVIKLINSTNNNVPITHSFDYTGILICCVAVVIFYFKVRQILKDDDNDVTQNIVPVTTPDYYYYSGQYINLNDADITPILQKYFTYYNSLSDTLKQRFTERVNQFMHSKTFRLPKDETFKEIPVLLSAAAVQLTFGLDDFLLPWFKNIYINSTEYFANDPHALRILAGNVEEETITIAWSHFLSGINNCEDGCNVGLHELAHALYYEYVVVENGNNKTFIQRFNLVMQEIDVAYNEGRNKQTLFTDYAFKNTQEFWAESIEIFFEKPASMQDEFPGLFYAIKTLLQQDPSNKLNPVKEMFS